MTVPIGATSPLRISVVMPSFNHARFIREAIDSVLSQDYAPVDLLVMDGGSRDDTVSILESYGDRIKFVSQRDKGQCDAINRGLAELRGDVICWLNSDDLFTPGALRNVAAAFTAHPETEFVYGKGWTISEDGQRRWDTGVLPLDRWKLIHHRNFIQQPSCFFRRRLFERTGPIDESLFYVMDWDLWIRFCAHRGLFVDEYLSINREYDLNKTQSGQFRRWREIRRMVGRYTTQGWPPVVWLYLIEAIIQTARTSRVLKRLEGPLSRVFMWWMMTEMSGRFSDGGVRRRFHVSVGNANRRGAARCRLSPLSRYDRSRLNTPDVRLRWRSDDNQRGVIHLKESGLAQDFEIPLAPDRLFTHFTFTSNHPGVRLSATAELPARRIVAFWDDVDAGE